MDIQLEFYVILLMWLSMLGSKQITGEIIGNSFFQFFMYLGVTAGAGALFVHVFKKKFSTDVKLEDVWHFLMDVKREDVWHFLISDVKWEDTFHFLSFVGFYCAMIYKKEKNFLSLIILF